MLLSPGHSPLGDVGAPLTVLPLNVGGPSRRGRALISGCRWELFFSRLQNTHPRQHALEQLLNDKAADDARKAGMGLWGLVNKVDRDWGLSKPLPTPCPFSSDATALRVCPPTERDCSWPPHHTLCPRYYWSHLGRGRVSRWY